MDDVLDVEVQGKWFPARVILVYKNARGQEVVDLRRYVPKVQPGQSMWDLLEDVVESKGSFFKEALPVRKRNERGRRKK